MVVYPRGDSVSVERRDTIYLGLINDTIPGSSADSTLHWNKYFSLYQVLLKDTAVTNVDTVLANLVDSLHDTDIGMVYRTMEILGDTATSLATYSSYNDTLRKESSDYLGAHNVLDYLGWMVTMRANEDTLETSDVNDLIDLAEKCPYTEGFSVILARAMLRTVDSLSFKEWTDTCELLPDSLGPDLSFKSLTPIERAQRSFQELEEVMVYPNPASDMLNVRLPMMPEKPWRLRIVGASGHLIRELPLNQQLSSLAVNELAAGLYYVTVNSEMAEQRYRGKFVIMRK